MIKKVGFIDHGTGEHQSNSVISGDGMSPSVTTLQGGTQQIKIIVAMRGRPGGVKNWTQQLEPRMDGLTNAISTAQKDCMLMEKNKDPVLIGRDGTPADEQEKTELAENCRKSRYRIRKLTPKECFRLQAVSDEDASKMLSINSNTQCYRQAGNSICVTVLMAIFSQLNIKGVKPWNDMTEDEIYGIIDSNK